MSNDFDAKQWAKELRAKQRQFDAPYLPYFEFQLTELMKPRVLPKTLYRAAKSGGHHITITFDKEIPSLTVARHPAYKELKRFCRRHNLLLAGVPMNKGTNPINSGDTTQKLYIFWDDDFLKIEWPLTPQEKEEEAQEGKTFTPNLNSILTTLRDRHFEPLFAPQLRHFLKNFEAHRDAAKAAGEQFTFIPFSDQVSVRVIARHPDFLALKERCAEEGYFLCGAAFPATSAFSERTVSQLFVSWYP